MFSQKPRLIVANGGRRTFRGTAAGYLLAGCVSPQRRVTNKKGLLSAAAFAVKPADSPGRWASLRLTTSGSFPLLAAVLLPVCMLAALGRSDARAVSGGGYGLVVLGIIGPTNVMQYQLDATLNDVVATLLGLGLAVIAFSALPPPASPSTRCWRARRRMEKGFRASVCAPDLLRPNTDRWLARMFDRLTQVGDDDGAAKGGQTLLLAGLLILVLRREDAVLGRRVRTIVQAKGVNAGPALRQLANHADCTALQHDRIVALSLLIGAGELELWPGLVGEHAR